MQKATFKKSILLLVMTLALCASFMSTHPTSADPLANAERLPW